MGEASEFTFFVQRLHTGQFVGVAALHRCNVIAPELGIWISEREHGYGGEAVKAVIDWSSERFSPTAYRYPVAVGNEASRRIAERLGGEVIGSEICGRFMSFVYRAPPHVVYIVGWEAWSDALNSRIVSHTGASTERIQ